jgi:IrrE N-terminal-like domain
MIGGLGCHPLVGWLRRRFGVDSPLDWAEAAACRLLQEVGQSAVPVDLAPLLAARKATAVLFEHRLPCEARLERGPAGFRVRLAGSLARDSKEAHRRFVIAHELGHTLFYDLNEAPPERLIRLPLHDPVEEETCDNFAAALLVPRWYLRDVCRELPSEEDYPALVDRICAECCVPRPRAAFRLGQRAPEPEHGGPRR